MDWEIERARLSFDGLNCSVDGMNGVFTGMIGLWDEGKGYKLLYRCVAKSYDEARQRIETELAKIEVPAPQPYYLEAVI